MSEAPVEKETLPAVVPPADYRDEALDQIVAILMEAGDEPEALEAARWRVLAIAWDAQRKAKRELEETVASLQKAASPGTTPTPGERPSLDTRASGT